MYFSYLIPPPPPGPLQVAGCQPENATTCDPGDVRSPLSVSSTISLTLNRTDSGAEFSCEALLDLGPEGPQPPPSMMSSPFNVTVYCESPLLICPSVVTVEISGETWVKAALFLNR